MPWRGPDEPGGFPTLGWLVGEWIQEYVPVPDGERKTKPYLLTDEMWRHLLWFFRLRPDAAVDMGPEAFVYYGAQLTRPQKWGKDPFAAAQICAHALGPVLFAGWDAAGEPVGRPAATPWIQCAGNAEEQCGNTFRPLVAMLRDGPLVDTPGLDIGDTRIKLPAGDGWIEPVTASAKARQGARITFATLTEPHLMTQTSGGVQLANTIKRNAAGMGGRWGEFTNAWDPSEKSAAQLTYEAGAPGVFLDYRPPQSHVDIWDDAALRKELIHAYGDSSSVAGGWVRPGRIMAEIRDLAKKGHEAEARRYFLNEVLVGERDAVDAVRWDARARERDLEPGDMIGVGFDGSRSNDCTSLVASRVSDGRWFHLATWNPAGYSDGRVPRGEVDQTLRDVFDAYRVFYLVGDPYRWQEYFDVWAARWPDRVVEYPTNNETRMDDAIVRFQTVFADEWTHDGDPVLSAHAKAAVLIKGRTRRPRPDEDPAVPHHYLKVAKKKETVHIDAFVAGILAETARGLAIEHGALEEKESSEPWVLFA